MATPTFFEALKSAKHTGFKDFFGTRFYARFFQFLMIGFKHQLSAEILGVGAQDFHELVTYPWRKRAVELTCFFLAM